MQNEGPRDIAFAAFTLEPVLARPPLHVQGHHYFLLWHLCGKLELCEKGRKGAFIFTVHGFPELLICEHLIFLLGIFLSIMTVTDR